MFCPSTTTLSPLAKRPPRRKRCSALGRPLSISRAEKSQYCWIFSERLLKLHQNSETATPMTPSTTPAPWARRGWLAPVNCSGKNDATTRPSESWMNAEIALHCFCCSVVNICAQTWMTDRISSARSGSLARPGALLIRLDISDSPMPRVQLCGLYDHATLMKALGTILGGNTGDS